MMDTQAVLKAGGAGAAVLVFLTLLSLIPCLGCFTWILVLLAYVGIGVLTAYWMTPPRDGGSGAKNGAIAAAIAATVAGLVNMVIQGAYFAMTGASQMTQALADLPPEQLEALREAGIDSAALGVGAVVLVTGGCCLLGILLAAGLGAAGGYYWGNSHPS